MEKRKIPFVGVSNDECIELNIEPYSDVKPLKRFWDKLQAYVSRSPYTAKSKTRYGGGGHIHVAIPERMIGDVGYRIKFLINLFTDMQNRPYLNWMFNEYGDNTSAEPILLSDELSSRYNTVCGLLRDKGFRIENTNWSGERWQRVGDPNNLGTMGWGTKGTPVVLSRGYANCKPMTIEFRIFDSPSTWSELLSQVLFTNRYLQTIECLTAANIRIPLDVKTSKDVLKLSKRNKCIKEFFTLIDQLDLNENMYKYCVQNYLDRKATDCLLPEWIDDLDE